MRDTSKRTIMMWGIIRGLRDYLDRVQALAPDITPEELDACLDEVRTQVTNEETSQ